MNKKIIISCSVLVVILVGIFFVAQKYKGAAPAVLPSSGNISEALPTATGNNEPFPKPEVNDTSFPLKVPTGFSISILAKNLSGARVIAQDKLGNLWVSRTKQGIVTQIEMKDGKAVGQNDIFKNLKNPHGLALDPDNGLTLYIAEETKISKVSLYTEDSLHKIADLPKGALHFTRTLEFGSDGRLYVSIGSTCNACTEKDDRLAAIYSMNKDGSDFKQVASGLRNSVFMATSPFDNKIWATEMGRDNLGDNTPPDEINIIEAGPSTGSGQNSIPNFGWPICYGQNIHDTDFDKNVYIQNPCNGKIPPHIEFPAHSAPLGFAFVPKAANWPSDFVNNIIVAFHGSWNRSVPTGYKLARVKLDSKGNYVSVEDFISGWLAKDGKTSLGRPVDVFFASDNNLFVSDDKAGVIYKIQYSK